jgi:hypothetical protein
MWLTVATDFITNNTCGGGGGWPKYGLYSVEILATLQSSNPFRYSSASEFHNQYLNAMLFCGHFSQVSHKTGCTHVDL